MTLIYLRNGRRLAAYAEHSWDASKSGYLRGSKNILYSFNYKKWRISNRSPTHGQYNNYAYGPTFGGGHDFCMYASMWRVNYCSSHAFSGPASNIDVCGGGGSVYKLEVYALGEARRHLTHANPPDLYYMSIRLGRSFHHKMFIILRHRTFAVGLDAASTAASPPPAPPPPPLPPPSPPSPPPTPPMPEIISGASNIATNEEFNFITEAINTGEKLTDMWVKCYDSETDTHDAATFHTNCNNRGATVTLVKTTDDKKVAAFSPLSYGSGSNSKWVNAPDVVIINLDTKKVNRFSPRSNKAVMDSPIFGPSHGYDYGTGAGPFWVQKDMTTIKCGYMSYNFPRAQEMSTCTDFLGGATKHEAQYLEVWALKTASTVAAGERNISIASQDDFVRMTNAIRRFRPSLERSEHDSVTPVSGMWEKCFDSTAPSPANTSANTGPNLATYRGDEQSNIVDNDEIDWIVGEISADFGSPLTALVHKCYDREVDALTSQEWHAMCNNFGATLTFIELINGKKIAMFLPDSMSNSGWRRSSNWKSSSMFTMDGDGRDLPVCA